MLQVTFQVSTLLKEIDAEALRVQASYSGPETYWLFYFRGAMAGVSSRLYGVQVHYNSFHSWFPPRFFLSDADYHVANMLFNMDSALECFVFGMNAIGGSNDILQFLEITKLPSLRPIRPANLIGKNPCVGYSTFFPSVQRHWVPNCKLIQAITDVMTSQNIGTLWWVVER